MIHNPKEIEFAENLIIKLFPDQFKRPLANIDRQTVEYLCNNYQNLKFRRILKAVELAWTDKLFTFITPNTRPVIQHVSQPSPIGRLVQPNPAPGSANPFIPSPKNIGTQAVQINLTPNNNVSPNGKAPRAKRSAPSLGPQTCTALFKKRKEQVENNANRNPDSFLIPHQTPQQLTKAKQGPNNSPVSNKPTKTSSTNSKDKPLSMSSLPTGLLQNIEKFTKNSQANTTAQKMPTPNGISTNGSSTTGDMLTIDINKPGPSGLNSKKLASNTDSAVVVEQTTKQNQTPISKPNPIVCQPTDTSKSPSIAIVKSPTVNMPDIMDTIAGGKRIPLNTNIPPSLEDIRRALGEDKSTSEGEKMNVTQKSQPDKAVIDKIIGK